MDLHVFMELLQQMANAVTTSIDHQILVSSDSASIRTFLSLYGRYSSVVIERANQQAPQSNVRIEARRPVSIKYCVDVKLIESAVDCGFIGGVDSHGDLDDETPRNYLDGKSEESKLP